MVSIVKNRKGFKIIKLSLTEVLELWGKYGGTGICDFCNKKVKTHGYYIAVLNDFVCEDCYKEFIDEAIHYEQDKAFEEKCYNDVKHKLEVLKLWPSKT